MTHRETSLPRVSFGMTLAGLLFLVNPLINVHDILPDAIGFLLVYIGLSRASDADAYFEDARRRAGFLCLLCTVKHLLSLTLLDSADSLTLPYTFASSVLEIVFVIPFFLALFKGFAYTSMRRGAEEVMKKTADTRVLCLIFVVLQSVLAFVPQIITFVKQQEEIYFRANSTYQIPTTLVYNYVLAFTLIAMLILGVLYAVRLFGFFGAVRRDKDYRASLYETSEEVRSGCLSRYASKTVGEACLAMIVCAVCVFDVRIDGVNYLPTFLSFLAALVAVRLFAVRGKKYKASPFLLLTLLPAIAEFFFSHFTGGMVNTLLHGELLKLVDTFELAFVRSPIALPILAVILLAEGVSLYIVMNAFSSKTQSLCKDALLGNHDRALLRSMILMLLTFAAKAGASVSRLITARMATDASTAKYISMRARMSALAMEEAKAANVKLAAFESAENAAFYLSVACAALAVFTVFSLFALKGEVTKEEE